MTAFIVVLGVVFVSESDNFRTNEIDRIAQIFMDHWTLLPDSELARAVATELAWPEAPDYEGDLWIVDGESPRSLAEKIVGSGEVVDHCGTCNRDVICVRDCLDD